MKAPATPLLRILDSLRRAARWHRRSLAAVAAALCVVATISALQPEREPTVPVVVAARDLAGGVALSDADLRLAHVPADLAPADAVAEAGGLVGQVLAAPASARTILTRTSVASGQQLAAPGLVVAALPLTDAAIAPLVRAGSRIDILGDTGERTGVIASNVRVVSTAESGGTPLSSDARVALVEVPPSVASRLAQAAQAGGVSITLR